MDVAETARPLRDAAAGVVTIGRAMAREWRTDRVGGLAAEVAFFGILSLFPLLLAGTAALGSLDAIAGRDLADRVEREVLEFLRDVLTSEASGIVNAAEDLFAGSSPQVLTFGAATAVWSASRAFTALIRALDVVYDLDERRGFIHTRVVALLLGLGSVVVAAITLSMLVLGPLLGTGGDIADRLGLGDAFASAWNLARWPAMMIVLIAWSATVFHIAPNHRTPWRWDLPGALLAAVIWAAVSVGLRLYLAVASGGNDVYGALGGALIALLWLYLLGIGLLLGGELNAELAKGRAARTDGDDDASGTWPLAQLDAGDGPDEHGEA